MNPLVGRLSFVYQKRKPFLDSVLLRRAPEFVYGLNPQPLDRQIPVFTFHIALPDWFDRQCRHLVENGYHTLSADEFLAALTGELKAPAKSVLITFDDGLKHVWSVAFPILEKYGLRATCFLIPGCVPEDDRSVRPGLREVWAGKASEDDVIAFRADESALATWEEIRLMHESGIVDFQSHTMHHSLVFTSDRILDFFHPGSDTHFYGNIHVPLYRQNDEDVISREPLLGMPVYYGAPRMQAEARFFDDEELRELCVRTVEDGGGISFFSRRDWRATLKRVVIGYRKQGRERARYETPEQRDTAVTDELVQSRAKIERRLPGHRVRHLCFPWFEAKPFAVAAARSAGFEACYFGLRRGQPDNRPGQDPMQVVRVEDYFLERLPGDGRLSLKDTIGQLRQLREVAPRIFPERGR